MRPTRLPTLGFWPKRGSDADRHLRWLADQMPPARVSFWQRGLWALQGSYKWLLMELFEAYHQSPASEKLPIFLEGYPVLNGWAMDNLVVERRPFNHYRFWLHGHFVSPFGWGLAFLIETSFRETRIGRRSRAELKLGDVLLEIAHPDVRRYMKAGDARTETLNWFRAVLLDLVGRHRDLIWSLSTAVQHPGRIRYELKREGWRHFRQVLCDRTQAAA